MNTYIGTVREREKKGLERKNPIDALVIPKRIKKTTMCVDSFFPAVYPNSLARNMK